MSRSAVQLSVCAMALSLAACAAMRQPGCQRSERLSTVDSLYFGAAYPGGVVTAEQWQMFVDSVVTPRFPEGLTLWQAAGQYRTNAGIIQHEASWVLQLVHQDAAQGETAIDEIRTEYRRRFRQESVLRVRSTTCVSFE